MNRFATIVADPPWEVKAGRPLGDYVLDGGRQLFGARGQRARNTKYPSMTVAEIAALPVANIAADDSHLYLWTINRYLDDAFDVARAWGFRPSTVLTWAKNPMGGGLGGCYGISTEFVLFCRRSMKLTICYAKDECNLGWLYRYDATYAGQRFAFSHVADPRTPRAQTAATLRQYRSALRGIAREHLKEKGMN